MKQILFWIYAFFFNMGASFPVEKKRIGLVSMHNANFNDGLYEIERELRSRGSYTFIRVNRNALNSIPTAIKFCTIDAYFLGGSKYIFLNDNFMPLAYLKPNPDTKIIQIWHGQGAFKKFGLHIKQPEKIREREIAANQKLDYVVCSSEGVRGIYSEAFGIPIAKVLDTGSPNEDYYFRRHDLPALRDEFERKYPSCKNKLLVLYAPTFRDDREADKRILENIAFKKLKAAFPCQVEILVRLHPQVHSNVNLEGVVDVTDYDNINELCMISDLLITDYSSICMDFSLMKKPMIFYAYDLDKYKGDRDFYFDYESYVPGPIATTMDELCHIIEHEDFQTEKNDAFRAFNFDVTFGTASKDLIDYLEYREELNSTDAL